MARPKLPDKKWNKITGTIQAEEETNYSNTELAEKLWEIVENHYD